MYCHNCGIKVGDNTRFCTSCGNKIVSNDTESNMNFNVSQSINQYNGITEAKNILTKTTNAINRFRKKIIICASVFLVAVICLIFIKSSSINSSPSDVVQAFNKAIYTEDTSLFLKCIDADNKNSIDLKALKQALHQKNDEYKKEYADNWVKEFKITSVEITNKEQYLNENSYYSPLQSSDAKKDILDLYNNKYKYYYSVNYQIITEENSLTIVKDKNSNKYYISCGTADAFTNCKFTSAFEGIN